MPEARASGGMLGFPFWAGRPRSRVEQVRVIAGLSDLEERYEVSIKGKEALWGSCASVKHGFGRSTPATLLFSFQPFAVRVNGGRGQAFLCWTIC